MFIAIKIPLLSHFPLCFPPVDILIGGKGRRAIQKQEHQACEELWSVLLKESQSSVRENHFQMKVLTNQLPQVTKNNQG